MSKIEIIISTPGILNGKQLFGLIFLGIKFDDMPIKILVKYNVNPIGIKTTTPAMK